MNTRPPGLGRIAAALGASILAGCACTLYNGHLDWRDGWRPGRVVAAGSGELMAAEMSPACRKAYPAAGPDSLFVTVRYRRDDRYAWRTVPVTAERPLAPGDVVFVNATDCAAPLEPAIPDGKRTPM